MKSLVLFLLLASTALSHSSGSHSHTHSCQHDQISRNMHPKPLQQILPKQSNRILQSSTLNSGPQDSGANWHDFRIEIDYSFSDVLAAGYPSLKSKYLMAQRIIESTRYYFQNNTKVFYKDTVKFSGGSCFNELLPSFEKGADLVLVFSTENAPELNYTMASTACFLSEIDDRPVIGSLIFNYAFFQFGILQEFHYFSNFAHEFTHVLGFSNKLFDKFVMPGTLHKRTDVVNFISIGGRKLPAITMPEVIKFAVEYFGCKTIQGLPLESAKDADFVEIPGSHWEKLFLPQEYMGPADENPGLISEFTHTFLRATGWYQIQALSAQPYNSGKGAGCSHFGICPAMSTDYCTKEQESGSVCSPNWLSKSSCVKDSRFGQDCFLKKSRVQSCATANMFQIENLESYSPQSSCLDFVAGGSATAKCLEVVCDQGNLIATVGREKITCTTSEKGVKKPIGDAGDNIHLVCPDSKSYCSHLAHRCQDDCNRNGICLGDNKCHCFGGWTGESCAGRVTEQGWAETPIAKAVMTTADPQPETKSHSHLNFNILFGGLVMLAMALSQ